MPDDWEHEFDDAPPTQITSECDLGPVPMVEHVSDEHEPPTVTGEYDCQGYSDGYARGYHDALVFMVNFLSASISNSFMFLGTPADRGLFKD